MGDPDLEQGMQHVDVTDFAQATAATDVPDAETAPQIPRQAQQATADNAETVDTPPIQGQQDPSAHANPDTPKAATPADTTHGVSCEAKRVVGLNLRDVMRKKGWRPRLGTHSASHRLTTKFGPKETNPQNPSVFAALFSKLSRTKIASLDANEDAIIDDGVSKVEHLATVDDGVLKIEYLHRYNILWARSRLLRHFHQPNNVDLVNDEVADQICSDLHKYSNALRDYRLFRTEGELLFKTDHSTMDTLAEKFVKLEVDRSRLKDTKSPESVAAKTLADTVDQNCKDIGEMLFPIITKTSSGMTKEESQNEKQAFGKRLLAALGGGIALIAPMLIMVLAPPARATALATTSCFVLAVAIALAIFMDDSQPKDIVACTAAYTAVLVVFVGVGGGT